MNRRKQRSLFGKVLASAVAGVLLLTAQAVQARHVVCAGDGPLVDATIVSSSTPVPVLDLRNVTSVDVIPPQMAVRGDGTVWTWGASDLAQVAGLDGVIALAHTEDGLLLALKADGTVWREEGVAFAQVLDPTPTDPNRPLTNVKAIAASADSCFVLKNDGSVWNWSGTNGGPLCDGSGLVQPFPVQCPGLGSITAISVSRYHGMALKSDGTVWTWGSNVGGELGIGTIGTWEAPQLTAIKSFPGGGASPKAIASAIAATYQASYVVRSDGTVWSCGTNNGYGALGIGSTDSGLIVPSWRQVSGLTKVKGIFSGQTACAAVAVKSDGSAWAWGYRAGGAGCGLAGAAAAPCQVRDVLADSTGFLSGVLSAGVEGHMNCFVVPSPVHVSSIVMAKNSAGGKVGAKATVTVLDEFGQPVSGAVVSGHWTGLATNTVSGPTGLNGSVTLLSTLLRNPSGTFFFTVDSVTKTGFFLDLPSSVLSNYQVVP